VSFKHSLEDLTLIDGVKEMFDWGLEGSSGKTFAISGESDLDNIITADTLQHLCLSLSRGQQELLREAEEANEVHDSQNYEVEDEADGYVKE
jgi:hypothetical protein